MARAKPAQVSGNRYQMFINGDWVDSESEEKINIVNPATEKVIASVPKASREQTKSALEAAEEAQPKWEDLAPVRRASFLHQTDRKSTRLNSSHGYISYAVFCLKKKTKNKHQPLSLRIHHA